MLLTPREVAERLSVSTRTIYTWLDEGRLPCVKLSERVTRIPERAVDALLDESSRSATQGLLAAEATALYCPTCGGTLRYEKVARLTPAERLGGLLQDNREEILRIVTANLAENVRVFGSVARGDAREDSDIDLLVDLLPGASLFDLGGICYELEELLGRKVDVVTAHDLREGMRDRVLREAVIL